MPSLANPWMHLTLAVLALAAAAQSLVAIWAATSTIHWFWRALAVWAAVAALVPIRAYEPALIFALSSCLIIATVCAARFFHSPTRADHLGPKLRLGPHASKLRFELLRFALRDLFLGFLLLGLSLALIIHIVNRAPDLRWQDVIIPALILAVLALLVFLASTGKIRTRLFSLVLLLLLVPVAGALLHSYVKWMDQLSFGGDLNFVIALSLGSWDARLFRVKALSFGIVELLAFLLVATTIARGNTSRIPWRRSLARISLGGLSLVLLAGAALFYWPLLWLDPLPSTPDLPVNKYNEVMAIAQRIAELNRSEVSLSDFRAADPTSPDAAELESLYEKLLLLLQSPSALDYERDDNAIREFRRDGVSHIQLLRSVSSSLQAEHQAAIAKNDLPRAAAFAQANLRLGFVCCRGGLMIDALIGHAVMFRGIDDLATMRANLDAGSARAILDTLTRLESEHESIDVIVARDLAVMQRAYGWTVHLGQVVERLLGSPEDYFDIPRMLNRSTALNRLLRTDLAIRLYRAEHGHWPQTLDDLVPGYLPRLPLDPYRDEPFLYGRPADEFTLYSVGRDSHDDGGRFTNLAEYEASLGYDLDLDTLLRPK